MKNSILCLALVVLLPLAVSSHNVFRRWAERPVTFIRKNDSGGGQGRPLHQSLAENIDQTYTDFKQRLTCIKDAKQNACFLFSIDPHLQIGSEDKDQIMKTQDPKDMEDEKTFIDFIYRAGPYITAMCRRSRVYWLASEPVTIDFAVEHQKPDGRPPKVRVPPPLLKFVAPPKGNVPSSPPSEFVASPKVNEPSSPTKFVTPPKVMEAAIPRSRMNVPPLSSHHPNVPAHPPRQSHGQRGSSSSSNNNSKLAVPPPVGVYRSMHRNPQHPPSPPPPRPVQPKAPEPEIKPVAPRRAVEIPPKPNGQGAPFRVPPPPGASSHKK